MSLSLTHLSTLPLNFCLILRYHDVYLCSLVIPLPLKTVTKGQMSIKHPTYVKVYSLIVTSFNRLSMGDYENKCDGYLKTKKDKVQNWQVFVHLIYPSQYERINRLLKQNDALQIPVSGSHLIWTTNGGLVHLI